MDETTMAAWVARDKDGELSIGTTPPISPRDARLTSLSAPSLQGRTNRHSIWQQLKMANYHTPHGKEIASTCG